MTPRAAVTLIFALNGALFGSWAARIPAIQERLGLGEGELSIPLAAIAVGALVAMPLSGGASARWGSRLTTRAGVVAFAAATALPALAPDLLTLSLAAFLFGASGGSLDVAMNAQGTAVERRARRFVLSSMHAAFSAGGLVGAATGAAAAGAGLDVRVHLAAAAGLALAIGLVAGGRLLASAADAAPEGPTFSRPTGRLWALGMLAFCCLLAEGAAADWSAVYVDGPLGGGAAVAGLAYAAFSLTMTLGRLAGDRLAEAVGSVTLMRASGVVAGAGLGAALVIGHPVAALAGFALLGAGLSVVIPLTFRAASSQPGVAPGPALAAVSTLGYLGFLAGPPLIGALAEATSLPTALGVVAALAAGTAVLGLATGTVAPAAAAGAEVAPVAVVAGPASPGREAA